MRTAAIARGSGRGEVVRATADCKHPRGGRRGVGAPRRRHRRKACHPAVGVLLADRPQEVRDAWSALERRPREPRCRRATPGGLRSHPREGGHGQGRTGRRRVRARGTSFGWRTALLYVGLGLAVAIAAGWVIGRLRMERHLQGWVRDIPRVPAVAVDTGATLGERVGAGFASVREIVGKVWPPSRPTGRWPSTCAGCRSPGSALPSSSRWLSACVARHAGRASRRRRAAVLASRDREDRVVSVAGSGAGAGPLGLCHAAVRAARGGAGAPGLQRVDRALGGRADAAQHRSRRSCCSASRRRRGCCDRRAGRCATASRAPARRSPQPAG